MCLRRSLLAVSNPGAPIAGFWLYRAIPEPEKPAQGTNQVPIFSSEPSNLASARPKNARLEDRRNRAGGCRSTCLCLSRRVARGGYLRHGLTATVDFGSLRSWSIWQTSGVARITSVPSAERRRGGRQFEPTLEAELHNLARDAASSLPGARNGLLIIDELVGPIGIPDFVAVVGHLQKLQERISLGVPPLLNELDAAVVGATSDSAPRTLKSISATLGWSEDVVQSRVPELHRKGALIKTGRATYLRPNGLRPVGNLYAIETKVSAWPRAVEQGRKYKVWCDSYVLVFGFLSDQVMARLLSEVERDNAGVVVNGKWKRRPKISRKPNWQRLLGSEHVVAAIGSWS